MLLDTINSPEQLRLRSPTELKTIADELRAETVRAVSVTGGHLGASLGVVELTVALHYVFDTPRDRLIWDVGHQAYPHKILTRPPPSHPHAADERRAFRLHQASRKRVRSVRRGACRDFDLGRARDGRRSATSPAAAHKIIAVIGDGSISAGMAYEAMNNAGATKSRLIVILNDNEMSIAPPVGAMSAYLGRLTRTAGRPAGAGKSLSEISAARAWRVGGTMFEETGVPLHWADRRPRLRSTFARPGEGARGRGRPDAHPRRHPKGQGLCAGGGIRATNTTASPSSTSRPEPGQGQGRARRLTRKCSARPS